MLKKKTSQFLCMAALSLICVSVQAGAADKQATAPIVVVHAKRYGFAPAEITLKKNETVNLELVSDDVLHSLVVRGLNINVKSLKPGESTDIAVTPAQVGDFKGTCGVFCGIGHGSMSLVVHVVDAQ